MDFCLKKVCADDYDLLKKYFSMRRSVICESVITDTYLWKNYYDTKYIVTESGLLWLYDIREEIFSTTPLCKPENLKENFILLKQYFNEELHQKLVLYLVDEEAVELLSLPSDLFEVEEERNYFDYLYDADKLRRLPGKAYHKKKNHLNAFLKEYDGRYESRILNCQDKQQVLEFIRRWHESRNIEDSYHRDDYEIAGIEYVLNNCCQIKYTMFGVFIDGKMEAFSLGTYDQETKTAFIHVEKANPDIRGLYAFINSQFLCIGFPDADFVNREDDMGLEGLRKAKLSYQPIELIKKYTIRER